MANVDALRQARDSVVVIYAKYLREKSKGIQYHVFVEGEDDPAFYMHSLSASNLDIMKTMIYKCKNKDGVLATYYKMKSLKVNLSNTLFIKDRDYDDFAGITYPTDIYSTDHYSIESEMFGEKVIKRIWLGHLRNLSDKSSLEKFIHSWQKTLESFVRNFGIKFYASLIYMYRRGQSYNLDKINVLQMMDIKSDGRILFPRGKVRDQISNVSELDHAVLRSDEYKEIEESLKAGDPCDWIVGKHILTIFSKFVENYIGNILKITSPSMKCSIQIQLKNPSQNFFFLTDIPTSLSKYIESRVNR